MTVYMYTHLHKSCMCVRNIYNIYATSSPLLCLKYPLLYTTRPLPFTNLICRSPSAPTPSLALPNPYCYRLFPLTTSDPIIPSSHLGPPKVSLISRPSASIFALALPAFTASLASPYLNLPQPTSPPSSSTAAPTVTTLASITPISSTSYIPAAPQLPPYISNKIPTLSKKLIDSILA